MVALCNSRIAECDVSKEGAPSDKWIEFREHLNLVQNPPILSFEGLGIPKDLAVLESDSAFQRCAPVCAFIGKELADCANSPQSIGTHEFANGWHARLAGIRPIGSGIGFSGFH
jgi:hypothetical protein